MTTKQIVELIIPSKLDGSHIEQRDFAELQINKLIAYTANCLLKSAAETATITRNDSKTGYTVDKMSILKHMINSHVENT